MTEKKWVYLFSEVEKAEDTVGGDWEEVRSLLGGKGAGLPDHLHRRQHGFTGSGPFRGAAGDLGGTGTAPGRAASP